MTYYEGLSCPVCNQPFTADSDVVVCPHCGLPHHRNCWAKENHCHMADKHGTPEQWSRDNTSPTPEKAETDDKKIICPSCATPNPQYAEFCTRCGTAFEAEDWHSTPPPPVNEYTPRYTPFSPAESYSDSEIIGNVTAKELAAVVGSNTLYYMDRFRRTNQNKTCGWNWAAFLLGPVWMLYRKQYFWGVFLFIVETVCSVFSNLFSHSIYQAGNTTMNVPLAQMMESPWFTAATIASTVIIGVRVLLGLFGNNLYFTLCKNKIQKAKLEIPDISSFELTTKGGVSFVLAITFYFLSSLVTNIVYTFIA